MAEGCKKAVPNASRTTNTPSKRSASTVPLPYMVRTAYVLPTGALFIVVLFKRDGVGALVGATGPGQASVSTRTGTHTHGPMREGTRTAPVVKRWQVLVCPHAEREHL